MKHYPALSESENTALMQLCRDDGYTMVTDDLIIQTASKTAPNLGAIIDVLQGSQAMLGRSVLIEEVPQSMIDSALSGMGEESQGRSTSKEETHAIERQLIALCQTAVDAGSSDVHVMVEREKTHFLLRTNGLRRVIERFHNAQSALNQPREVGVTLINYVFSTLGSQDVKLSRPANDRFSVVLKVEGQSREFEWRAALIPTHDGAKLTLRCLTPKNKALRLEDMDLPAPYLSTLMSMMRKRQGAIVITGPMGSGKSSLVYALLEKIDRVSRSVHSLEDPVEFSQGFVSKTQVEPTQETVEGSGVKLDYAFYCKETLRHDVDISNIGEIRDTATASEFCRKAETGGLALATLHTNSALGVAQTFVQQLHIPAAIVGAPDLMAMFVHVKLVRSLCECAFDFTEHASESVVQAYQAAGQSEQLLLKVAQIEQLCSEPEQKGVRLLNPLGCECCKEGTTIGEKGRAMVMEMIVLDDEDRRFIINEDDLGWKRHLEAQGYPDIKAHCKSRIVRGQVDILSASEQVDNLIPLPVTQVYSALKGAL